MPTSSTILLTGATDGLGLALARHYQAQGSHLILLGRRPLATLDHTLFTVENYCSLDLAIPDCAVIFLSWLHERSIGTINLVIHNAAIGYVGPVAAQTGENIRQLVAVNLQAPIALTHALLPLVEAAQGKFVFISSVAAALPAPDYAVYAATKAALDGFVRNWQVELAAEQRPITAQLIHPGAIRTNLHAKSGADLAPLQWDKFPSAEHIAAQVVHAINTNRHAVTLGLANRLGQFAGRHLPSLVDWTIARTRPITALSHAPAINKPVKPHCLITGAADGIGKALAHTFAAAGYTITGIDIDAERALRTQAELINRGGAARFLLADLAQPDNLARTIIMLKDRPPLDVLVHNAGINAVGAFATSDPARQRAVIEVNFTAPLLLTAALLNEKRLNPGGSLVFIVSLSHFVGYPGAAVYAASKDGLAAYARSVRLAVAPLGIRVLTVYPGPTRTEHARRHSPDNRREGRRMAPQDLARQILRAVQTGKQRLIPGVGNRIFARLGRLFPGLMAQMMRRTIFDKLRA